MPKAWLTLAMLLVLLGISALILMRESKTGYSVWEELNYRTPGELIRYTLERLEGHPTLENVANPILHAAQRRIERPEVTPRSLIDTLGKGQQAQALPRQMYDGSGHPLPLDAASLRLHKQAQTVTPATGETHWVRDAAELKAAAARARAGDVILLTPGRYLLSGWLQPKNDGTAEHPIIARAETPGTVVIEINSGAIHQDRAHWIYENLVLEGHCGGRDVPCEHAFHVVGGAHDVVIRNNLIRNFAAHIKVNGEHGQFPDSGLLQFNTLTNDNVYGHGSLTPFDLVGASHWIVSDNHVSHFVKEWGKNASYGVFMKGGGEGGRIERNVLICTTDGDISHFGSRVGISLGGGLTEKPFCPDKECIYEHRGGVVINNVVMNCNDFGIDNNRSIRSLIAHNTVINTYGIGVRGIPSDAEVYGNAVDGAINARRGGTLVSSRNLRHGVPERLQDPYRLDFTWRHTPDLIPTHPLVHDDFCGVPRAAQSLPGAFGGPDACSVPAPARHQ
jgi:hypothetical protein